MESAESAAMLPPVSQPVDICSYLDYDEQVGYHTCIRVNNIVFGSLRVLQQLNSGNLHLPISSEPVSEVLTKLYQQKDRCLAYILKLTVWRQCTVGFIAQGVLAAGGECNHTFSPIRKDFLSNHVSLGKPFNSIHSCF